MSKLSNMLLHALGNSDYYRHNVRISSEVTVEDFPVLTKENLKKHCEEIIIDQFRYGDSSILKSAFTSGSTGISTVVYWDNNDYVRSNMCIWRLRKAWYGVAPDDKQVVFTSMKYDGHDLIKPPKIELSNNGKTLSLSKFYLNDNNVIEYIDIIRKYAPRWMSLQTSTLIRIIDVLKKYELSLPSSIKYIELNGEVVTQSNVNYFRKFINIPIANLYGAMEVNSIAYECPYHSLHVLHDNIYIEKCKINNEEHTLVTSLHNTAMPIIRYDLNDIVLFSDKKSCPCGYHSQIIDEIQGRCTDRIYLSEETYINAYTLVYYIESVNLLLHNSIVQYKIVQNEKKSIIIQLVVNPEFLNWERTITEEILRQFHSDEQLATFSITISFVKTISASINSKFKVFENLIGDGDE